MKELKQYQCEICNTVYKSLSQCKSCEDFHCKPKSIVEGYFQPEKNGGLKYPQKILVEMEDGEKVYYEYKGVKKQQSLYPVSFLL